jgi:hypothetical protein
MTEIRRRIPGISAILFLSDAGGAVWDALESSPIGSGGGGGDEAASGFGSGDTGDGGGSGGGKDTKEGNAGGGGGRGGERDGNNMGLGLSALDQQARAMLEKTIAARGAVFLGTPFSTFTAHIARMRRQFGAANDLDGLLCEPAAGGGGGGGGGGVKSGLRFDHPGKWGVVWSNATSLLGDRRDDDGRGLSLAYTRPRVQAPSQLFYYH